MDLRKEPIHLQGKSKGIHRSIREILRQRRFPSLIRLLEQETRLQCQADRLNRFVEIGFDKQIIRLEKVTDLGNHRSMNSSHPHYRGNDEIGPLFEKSGESKGVCPIDRVRPSQC